ncbi:MAG: NADH-quinone oxidoreductase subunit H [Rikenellaceae bacterium]|jgi:formate hydrogenlyase subunit 4|nr:NADH-quinone oxidoreductase subunit H [Rikenellaceae bacterium]
MQGAVTIFLILLLSLLLPGVVNRVRAVLAGRRGVSLYQHISNLEVLLRKGAVYSPTATALFRVAPAVYLAAMVTALLLLPLGYFAPLLSFKGDVVMFCYLLAAGRVALVLAALDTGSSFEGMGAAREALYGALVEPALMVVAGTLALITGYASFAAMFSESAGVGPQLIVAMLLLCYAIFKIYIVEAGRVPADDPRTHLELTMIHEVMVLDYTGVDLGLITLAGWLRNAALSVLAGNVVAALVSDSVLVAMLVTVLVAVATGVTESLRARNRLSRNTTYILTILAVALLVFFVAFLLKMNIDLA